MSVYVDSGSVVSVLCYGELWLELDVGGLGWTGDGEAGDRLPAHHRPALLLQLRLQRVRVFFVGVEVDSLGEPLHTDKAEVGLLPAVHQLVPLQLRRGWEPLVTKLTGIFFLELFFQQGQLLKVGKRIRFLNFLR